MKPLFYRVNYFNHSDRISIDTAEQYSWINLNAIKCILEPRQYLAKFWSKSDYEKKQVTVTAAAIGMTGDNLYYFIPLEEYNKLIEYLQSNNLLINNES